MIDILPEGYDIVGKYDYIDISDELFRVQFSYLDCGQDGVPELMVEISGIGIYSFRDDSTFFMLIKEKEGRLQCTFAGDQWCRWTATINEAGVYAGVSHGGMSTYGRMGIFDTNAEYHEIFSCEKNFDQNPCINAYASEEVPVEERFICVNECTTTIDGKEYTYYVEADTGEEMYSTLVKVEPACMRREEVVRLEDKALEKYGCTKECLEADDILFFTGDLQEIIDELRNVELYNPILPDM